MEIATIREQGNTAFRCGDFPRAIASYSQAIALATGAEGLATAHVEEHLRQDSQQQKQIVAALYSNRSAAELALGWPDEALQDANECIRAAPMWPKGYFRRALAQERLGNLDDAVASCEKALELSNSGATASDVCDKLAQLRARRIAEASSKGAAPPMDEKLRAFVDFAVQGISGPLMAIYRMNGGRFEQSMTDPMQLTVFFARYLNQVWMALLRNDDAFVKTSFDAMDHRSPVCLIHTLLAVGKAVLAEPLPCIATTPDASLEDRIGATRTVVHEIIRRSVVSKTIVLERLNHPCTGKSIVELRAEWEEKGRPHDEFFMMSAHPAE